MLLLRSWLKKITGEILIKFLENNKYNDLKHLEKY